MSPTARAALIGKIKKCLALSASANEHEAAAALDRAQAMMREHGISADDVDLSDVAEALAKGTGAQRPARWETLLAAAIARSLDCTVLHQPQSDANGRWDSRWCFIGIGPSAEIATYAWTTLYRQLRRQRAAYQAGALRRCKPARKRQRADIFCEAWASAIYSKVAHLAPKPATAALIERHIAASIGELAPCDSRAAKAKLTGALANDWMHGRAAGRGTDLHAGVGADRNALLGYE